MATYIAPYIDATGVHVPLYADIRDDLILQFKNIYGQDVYIESDSQDYQLISAFTAAINDANQMAVQAYNNTSPATAFGVGLDRVVALNGIRRKTATFSTAVVTITGTAGTIINNGVIADINGLYWYLPSVVTILSGGTVDTTATCAVAGRVTAAASDINKIVTPTYGWLTAINAEAALVGLNVETDAELRGRHALSAANASQSLFGGVYGAVAAVPDVLRYRGYENDTSAANDDGVPAHSITFVVEGGTDQNIAGAIYLHKSIGCGTNGDVHVSIPIGDGSVSVINFYRPTYIPIYVQVTLTKLSGYTTADGELVKTNIMNYMNSLPVGEDVQVPSLYQPIYASIADIKSPTFACTALTALTHTTQVETAVCEGTISVAGDATITFVDATIAGAVGTLALVTTDTPSTIADKARTALSSFGGITAKYIIGGAGANIVATRKIAAANDTALNIALAHGSCTGLTDKPTSTDTQEGVAPSSTIDIGILEVAQMLTVDNIILTEVT